MGASGVDACNVEVYWRKASGVSGGDQTRDLSSAERSLRHQFPWLWIFSYCKIGSGVLGGDRVRTATGESRDGCGSGDISGGNSDGRTRLQPTSDAGTRRRALWRARPPER